MNEYLQTAVIAAKEAGEFIVRRSLDLRGLTIEQKSLNDFVSEVDRCAERLVRNAIKSDYPDHSILGEEYGISDGGQSEFQWVVDPLDGTTNFLRGIPHYAVSIALVVNSEPLVGVVYDPLKGELFSARKGHGAFLNDQPIKCSTKEGIKGALIATGIPFNGELLVNIDRFSDAMVGLLNQQTSGIRRLGAAALDLAYVAAGRYDGFWEASLKPWDIAAGILIVTEAGGVVADFDGMDKYLESGNIVACSDGVFDVMHRIVCDAYSLDKIPNHNNA